MKYSPRRSAPDRLPIIRNGETVEVPWETFRKTVQFNSEQTIVTYAREGTSEQKAKHKAHAIAVARAVIGSQVSLRVDVTYQRLWFTVSWHGLFSILPRNHSALLGREFYPYDLRMDFPEHPNFLLSGRNCIAFMR